MEPNVGLEEDLSMIAYCENIRSYYAPPNGQRDIAKEAYDCACAFVEAELQGSELADMLGLKQYTTMEDVRIVVEQVKSRYEQCSPSKKGLLKHLAKFSARIMYFGQVLDVFSQHHPEYVALAWGSLKFVFMGIISHSRLITEFSQALAKISDALRQTKLTAELFQTDPVRDAISQLYAHIMLFFQQAIRWYNRSSAGRAFSSIFKPFELEYKDTVEQIKLCAEAINDIASAASRAEVRDMHITIQLMRNEMRRRDQKLTEMQIQVKETQRTQLQVYEKVNSSLQIATMKGHKAITERIHFDVRDMMPRIRDMQFSDILQTLKPSICPQQTFTKIQAITKRSRSTKLPVAESITILQSLNTWFSRAGSSLFILRVGLRAETKAMELTTDIIAHLKEKQVNVLFRLSPLKSSGDRNISTLPEVLKVLVLQALQLDPTILHAQSNELNVSKFSSMHTEAEWISLLTKLITRLAKCYIVIETHDLFHEASCNPDWVARFISIFSTLMSDAMDSGASLKLLVLCYGGGHDALMREKLDQDSCIVSTLRRPILTPMRLKRTVSYKRNAKGWQRMQPKF